MFVCGALGSGNETSAGARNALVSVVEAAIAGVGRECGEGSCDDGRRQVGQHREPHPRQGPRDKVLA